MKTSSLYAFVDKIEENQATLILVKMEESPDSVSFTLPQTHLPLHTKEGSWLTFSFQPTNAPPAHALEKINKLRERLSAKDDGKDFAL